MAGCGRSRRRARAGLLQLGVVATLLLVSGCSWVSGLFGSSTPTETTTPVSVFEVAIGQCFNPPTGPPKVELSDLTSVACSAPHTQESYAHPTYAAPAGGDDSIYPGDAALVAFAKGSCGQAFEAYVGVSYQDSSLFFTYLLPSARSWEQGKDRTVLCFVMTTGQALTATVKGSKL